MTMLTEDRGLARSKSSGGVKVGRPSFLWSLPAVVYFALFALLPLGVVAWLSFTKWNGIGAPHWIGTANWKSIFQDPVMIKSFKITAILTVLGVVTQTPVSMLIGVWAAGYQKNRAILSALYFVPLLMSAAAIAIVWFSLLNPYFGLPHELHFVFGGSLFNHGYLFSSQPAAIGVLTFVGMWQWTPFHTLIYQGGARAIPEVLYQAAAIDGAGRYRQFFHITLPQLRNTMVTSIVLMVVGGLTTFDSILILTQGGPGTATTSTSYYMYVQGFSDFNFGPASVIAVLLVVVTTLVSIALVRATGWDKMRSTQEGL
ncbi:MAG TPA: sugar ABC transporter permease [Solirubrobacteraceae bacterium]|nr:sugar ABC transporter permease [Solirubrobacteraceae bacterium]